MANTEQRIVSYRIAVGFDATDWVSDMLTVLRTGVPANRGEIGPHNLSAGRVYYTTVYQYLSPSMTKEVGLTVIQDRITGDISLMKAAIVPDFAGVAFIQSY